MPEDAKPEAAGAQQQPLQGELVQRAGARAVRARDRPDFRAIRQRVVELARNPAAVATATVVTGIAVNVVREAARSGVLRRNPAVVPVEVTGQVVHYVHVIHHHLVHHHVVHATYLPRIPPALPPSPR